MLVDIGGKTRVLYSAQISIIYYTIMGVGMFLFFMVFRGKKLTTKSAIIIGIQPGFFMYCFTNAKVVFIIMSIIVVIDMYGDDKYKEMLKGSNILDKITVTLKMGYKYLASIICFLMVIVVLPLVIRYNYIYRQIKMDVDKDAYKENGSNYVENNKDKLLMLNKEKYKDLSQEERLEALNYLVQLQMDYLGVDDKITLYCDNISGQGLAGYANYDDKEIVVDSKIMMNNREQVMHTILHECYHIYQHKCMELLEDVELSDEIKSLRMFKDIEQWRYETDNYKTAESDKESIEVYDSQSLEIEADAYSERWLKIYIKYIDK